jgi:hypothetical protein
MTQYTFNVAEIYRNIKIEADDEDEAREIAIMTIRDRWRDEVVADLCVRFDPCICECKPDTQMTHKELTGMMQRLWEENNKSI